MMAIKTTTHMHSLKAMLSPLIELESDIQFNEFVLDSRDVKAGDVFVAWQGHVVDGSEFIQSAINNGAVAVLVDTKCKHKKFDSSVPVIEVESLREKIGEVLNNFYQHASEKLLMLGVTGTNGKTSIAHALAACLSTLKVKTGLIGTIGNGIYPTLSNSEHTTPDVISLHKQIHAWSDKTEAIAMEVSSHALDQCRVAGIDFDIAVFSSFSRDHLDYHETMDDYFAAKQRLFQDYDLKHAVINNRDTKLSEFANSLSVKNVWRYELLDDAQSFHDKQTIVQAKIVSRNATQVTIAIRSPWGSTELTGHWMADFICENLLAVLTVLCLSGKDFDEVIQSISDYQGVPGRMETIALPNGASSVIDYAHTPDALEKALTNLKVICKGKLVCVFGCGGDRDQGKRKLMAQVAEVYADKIIITNDNPRTEAPENIAKDILKGLSDKARYEVELDRAFAIQSACEQAQADDIILIAGKGHENYQIIGQQKFPFSDRECVKRFIGVSA